MRRRGRGKKRKKLINGRKKPRRLASRNGAKFASMMQLIFFFTTLWFRHRLKSGERWRYFISFFRIILSYFPYFRPQERGGGGIKRDENSPRIFIVVEYLFLLLLDILCNLETWKVEEIKANDYSRDEKFSSTGWKRKYRSCVVHQPVIFLWRRCIRYRMWILMEKVVAHLTAPRLIDIFHGCRKEEGERTRGIVKNWKVIPRAIIYLSFLLVFPLFYFLDNINPKRKVMFEEVYILTGICTFNCFSVNERLIPLFKIFSNKFCKRYRHNNSRFQMVKLGIGIVLFAIWIFYERYSILKNLLKLKDKNVG